MIWTVMPFINCWDMTRQAIDDVLAQTVETRLLLIDQGSDEETRTHVKELRMDPQYRRRILAWHFDPGMPLSAAWNQALAFVNTQGGEEAWIINNDVRLVKHMAEVLSRTRKARDAYFVSGVGVDRERWENTDWTAPTTYMTDFGGPDFSNFLISIEGWGIYPFDERFRPAYCEDVDMHRRMMLGSDGQKIFGINCPFLHYGSATINAMSGGAGSFSPIYEDTAAVYARKWGGKPNKETYFAPLEDVVISDATRTEHLKHQGKGPWTTPHLHGLERDAFTIKQERAADAEVERAEPNAGQHPSSR